MEHALKKFKKRMEFIQNQLHIQGSAKQLRSIFWKKDLTDEEYSRLKSILVNETDEKVYQYTANVISLYGGLESFVEDIAEEYLKKLAAIFPSYKDLISATGIGDYMPQGISLLNHAEERKFKDLPKRDVLKGLYEAIVNDDSRALHSEAFIDVGGGNYRHETIMKCLSHLGLRDIDGKLKEFDPLKKYIELNDINPSSNLFTKIDYIVERRNELSHGSGTPELMDADAFLEYLSFMQIYAETINNYLINLLKHYGWVLVKSDVIEPRVFSNNRICLKADQVAVGTLFTKGQHLLVLRDGKYYEGEIENIRVNDVDYDSYNKESAETEIGLKINSNCDISKGSKIKIKKLQ